MHAEIVMTAAFPILDLSPLLAEAPSAATQAALAREIGQACETIGFFGVRGHGIPPDVVRALYAAAYDFFDLPPAEKLAVKRPKPEQNRGYIGHGDETLARLAGRETPPDRKEIFCDRARSTCRTRPISLAPLPIRAWLRISGRHVRRHSRRR